MIRKNHQFIELNFRPWPILTSLGIMNLAMSIINILKFSTYQNLTASILIVTTISLRWWFSIKNELNKSGRITKSIENSFKISMILFISSEILFFFSIFWAYQHFNLVPEIEIGASWPPFIVKIFDSFSIPILNTAILLSSGITITIAHKIIIKKLKIKIILIKLSTIFLGVAFSIFQYQEYKNSFFSIPDRTFGTTFFLITGFHGIHVLIGTMYLTINIINQYKINSSKENLRFEIAAWYWHFVDVVWLMVYFILYYNNNNS